MAGVKNVLMKLSLNIHLFVIMVMEQNQYI